MKRVKGRIILGTTAVAAALTFSGCRQTPSGQESGTAATAETADTADTADNSDSADTGKTILDFEEFDVNENYNNVVSGPPADR